MKYFLLSFFLLVCHGLNAQHFIVENPVKSFLVDFNGDSNLYLQMRENGLPRGYIGSFSGSAADFDLGTSASNLSGNLHLTIRASPKATLNTSGNFGIGTLNPLERLHVNGNIRLANDADMFGLDQIFGFNDLRFYGDPTDGPDLFIAANGNVGIGTTSPQETFHLRGTMMMGDLLFFATPVSFRMWGNLEPQDTNPTFHFRNLGATCHWWRNVYALNFLGPSDRRFKKDIRSLDYGLETILKLRPVSFLWKHEADGSRKYGLIAQELIDIIPEMVHDGSQDLIADGIDPDENTGHYSVSYIELIPVLIKAIQDQQDLIKTQQKEILSLKDRLLKIDLLEQKVLNLELASAEN